MKFACDQCHSQYSIADERVAGRSMTIRCKRCQHLITVTAPSLPAPASPDDESTLAIGHHTLPATLPGNSLPPPIPAAPVRARVSTAPAQLDVPWFVSLDGSEVGPLTLPQARDWVAARVGHGDMHCWSEGFDDWMPVEKVSHFRILVAPKPAEADPFAALPGRESRASEPPPSEDGDLNIGEVSRIVNLAELARNEAANKARRTSKPLEAASAAAPRQTVMRAAVSMPPVSMEQVERAQEAMAEAKQHNSRASTAVLLVALVVALGATALILALAKPSPEQEAATVDAFASGTDELGRRVALPVPGTATPATGGTRRGPVGGTRGGTPTAGGTTTAGGAIETAGTVRPDKVEVGPEAGQVSPLTADDVIAVSSRMQSGTRRCYERAQKEDPFFKAPKIIVRLIVSKSGEVSSVSLDKVAETTFGRCLASTIKKWSFRPSTEGLAIDLPMVFGQS
ncbi:MAG: zinc-ribbon domain-containing protein [Myxococcales bacterium]|nr:zinc-ribbon domain-containing protein [Myxococcales bacterium]